LLTGLSVCFRVTRGKRVPCTTAIGQATPPRTSQRVRGRACGAPVVIHVRATWRGAERRTSGPGGPQERRRLPRTIEHRADLVVQIAPVAERPTRERPAPTTAPSTGPPQEVPASQTQRLMPGGGQQTAARHSAPRSRRRPGAIGGAARFGSAGSEDETRGGTPFIRSKVSRPAPPAKRNQLIRRW
jgi:hypothetical protein